MSCGPRRKGEVTGKREDCILSPTLFLLVLDKVMNKVVEGRKTGIQWRMMERLEDLDFADDICLLVQRWSDIKTELKKLNKEPAKMGFKIKEFKTTEIRVKPSTNLALTTNGRNVEQMKSFTYAGSIVTTDGGALEYVHSHIKKANGPFMPLYPLQKNKYIIEQKFGCVIPIFSQSYCMGVKHGK
jgi:hypothetical protein